MDNYVHYAKRVVLRKCLNTFVPHCRVKVVFTQNLNYCKFQSGY